MSQDNKFAVATGNWNDIATWSEASGGTAGAAVPGDDHHVIIEDGVNVTLNVSDVCASLTVNDGGTFTGTAQTLTLTDEGDASFGTEHTTIKIV